MNCENALVMISALLDGELTEQERRALQAHLDECPACRALQKELSGLHDACGGLDAQPPAELKTYVMAHLPAQDPPASAKKGKVISIHWKRWGAIAAALLLVAVAAWQLPHLLSPSYSSTAGGAADMAAAPAAPAGIAARDAGDAVVAAGEPAEAPMEVMKADTFSVSSSPAEEPAYDAETSDETIPEAPPTPAPDAAPSLAASQAPDAYDRKYAAASNDSPEDIMETEEVTDDEEPDDPPTLMSFSAALTPDDGDTETPEEIPLAPGEPDAPVSGLEPMKENGGRCAVILVYSPLELPLDDYISWTDLHGVRYVEFPAGELQTILDALQSDPEAVFTIEEDCDPDAPSGLLILVPSP